VDGDWDSGAILVTNAGTTSITSGVVSNTVAYGIAAVAVVFIIATGYLAMRRR
jgi:hypothetical protein